MCFCLFSFRAFIIKFNMDLKKLWINTCFFLNLPYLNESSPETQLEMNLNWWGLLHPSLFWLFPFLVLFIWNKPCVILLKGTKISHILPKDCAPMLLFSAAQLEWRYQFKLLSFISEDIVYPRSLAVLLSVIESVLSCWIIMSVA